MVSVSVFGQQYIIVNSAKTAVELLEKKSRFHSDRPVIQMGGELVGWRDTLVLIPYGHRFRNYRKMFHQVIGTYDAMHKFHHIEEMETHRFLKNVQAKPEELAAHIRRYVVGHKRKVKKQIRLTVIQNRRCNNSSHCIRI